MLYLNKLYQLFLHNGLRWYQNTLLSLSINGLSRTRIPNSRLLPQACLVRFAEPKIAKDAVYPSRMYNLACKLGLVRILAPDCLSDVSISACSFDVGHLERTSNKVAAFAFLLRILLRLGTSVNHGEQRYIPMISSMLMPSKTCFTVSGTLYTIFNHSLCSDELGVGNYQPPY